MSAAKRDENRIVSLILQNTLGTNVLYPTAVTLADSVAQHVAIVDGNGDQIISFGGGQQYTDAGTPPTHPVGTMPIFNNAGTWSQVGTANPLPVNLYTGGTALTQSGGNLLVNVQNFAVGAYGSGDAIAANLTSALTFSEALLFNGTTWDRWRGDTTNGAWVNVKTMASLPAGANTIGAVTQASGPWTVGGNIGSGSADSGNPVKTGGVYNTTQPTVTTGQRVDQQMSPRGSAFMTPYTLNNGSAVDYYADNADGVAVTSNQSSQPVIARNTMYNGTTWDRVRGDTTNGLWVNVKSQATLPAGTNTIGGVVTQPSTTSTALSLNRQTALSNTAVAVKASSGRIHKVHFYNPNSSAVFVQFYDVAQGSVTVGTTTPTWTWFIPAQGAYDDTLTIPLPAATAITVACTTTVAGGTAPTSGILAEIGYI